MGTFYIEFWTLRTVLTTTTWAFIVICIVIRFVHRANVVIFLGAAFAANTGRAFRTPRQHQRNDTTKKEKR
jgi:hypothetical protein